MENSNFVFTEIEFCSLRLQYIAYFLIQKTGEQTKIVIEPKEAHHIISKLKLIPNIGQNKTSIYFS